MARSIVQLLLMLAVSLIIVVNGLPSQLEKRYNVNNLNSTSILGILASTQSNATSQGLGSTVEISGIVTGETASSMEVDSDSGAEVANTNPGISSIASQVNCSEYSTSSAEGGQSAGAFASGDCLMNIDSTGNHNFENTVADSSNGPPGKSLVGMSGQANSPQQSGNSEQQMPPGGTTVAQATYQNGQEGSAEAYQIVSGPQTVSSFSGIITQDPIEAAHATQEVLMQHSGGETNIQLVISPFLTIEQ